MFSSNEGLTSGGFNSWYKSLQNPCVDKQLFIDRTNSSHVCTINFQMDINFMINNNFYFKSVTKCIVDFWQLYIYIYIFKVIQFFIYLFIYLWLRWVFVSVRGLSLVAASGGHSSSRCAGLSLLRPLLLRSTGSRRAGSAIVAHGPSCSVARGILPDQGSNPCPLHWQADSQPLRHQGSPGSYIFTINRC